MAALLALVLCAAGVTGVVAQEAESPLPANDLSVAPASASEKNTETFSNANDELPLGPLQADGQTAGGSFGSGSSGWSKTFGALGLVLGLILLLRWGLAAWARRHGCKPAGSGLGVEILGRQKLGPKTQLLFLRLGQRIIVASEGPGGLTSLAQITDPEETAALLVQAEGARDRSSAAGFRSWVNQFNLEHDSAENGPAEVRLNRETEGADDQEQYFDRARNEVQGLLARIQQLKQQSSGGDPS